MEKGNANGSSLEVSRRVCGLAPGSNGDDAFSFGQFSRCLEIIPGLPTENANQEYKTLIEY